MFWRARRDGELVWWLMARGGAKSGVDLESVAKFVSQMVITHCSHSSDGACHSPSRIVSGLPAEKTITRSSAN